MLFVMFSDYQLMLTWHFLKIILLFLKDLMTFIFESLIGVVPLHTRLFSNSNDYLSKIIFSLKHFFYKQCFSTSITKTGGGKIGNIMLQAVLSLNLFLSLKNPYFFNFCLRQNLSLQRCWL